MTVDAPYLLPAQIREEVPDLSDPEVISDERIAELVTEFEGVAERYRGVAFTPRAATSTIHRLTRRAWRLGHIEVTAITTVTIDGVTVDGPTLGQLIPDRLGDLLYPAPSWPHVESPPQVAYVHGLTGGVNGTVLRAARLYVWREAMAEANPNTGNAYVTTNPDTGTVERESTADWAKGRPTGWLDVDRLLNQVADRRPLGMG